ncbi:MAG: RNA polymerase sigma factor [Prolixibacteraceae bacterium]|nr:RNA polymerase sigma factor [Prolixibacteraceae bacterium]MBN2650439.1 RNA polymerase sigma factor [Prolixibacteraceae bacterium]
MDDDKIIIEEILKGEVSRFELLVKKYQQPVYNVIFRISGNVEDAKEITQDVFVKSYESLRNYKPDYKFFSWLYRIAINSALMHNKQNRRFVLLSENTERQPEFQSTNAEENEHKYKQLNKALIELPEKYKSVIVLKYYAALSYAQIATITGIDEKRVKSRLYDGRALLKELLAKANCI